MRRHDRAQPCAPLGPNLLCLPLSHRFPLPGPHFHLGAGSLR